MIVRLSIALVFASVAIGCSSRPGNDHGGGDGGDGSGGGGGEGGGGGNGGPPDMTPWVYPGPSATCVAPARPSTQTSVALAPALGGKAFSQPLAITQAPGDPARFFITQLSGQIRVVSANGTEAASFIDLTAHANEVKGGA